MMTMLYSVIFSVSHYAVIPAIMIFDVLVTCLVPGLETKHVTNVPFLSTVAVVLSVIGML